MITLIALTLLTALTLFRVYKWPPIAVLEQHVVSHHADLRTVSGDTVTCAQIIPVRAEEQQSARAWFVCEDDTTAPGTGWVYSWNFFTEGRRFSTPTRPVTFAEDAKWNR